MDLVSKFGGKKFVALLVYVLLVIFKDKIGIDEPTFLKLSGTLGTYFLGQGFADGLSKGKTSHAK